MSSLAPAAPPVKVPPRPRKPRQRRPHERSVAVLISPSEGQPDRLLRITQDGEPAHYWLAYLPSDFGRAFRLERVAHEATDKEGRDAYDVLLDGAADSCTCPGHVYGNYCKHVDGMLPAAPRPTATCCVCGATGPADGFSTEVYEEGVTVRCWDEAACMGRIIDSDPPALTAYKPAGHSHGIPF